MVKYFTLTILFFFANTRVSYCQNQDTSQLSYSKITEYCPTKENCNFYKENTWLPDAFIHNANCACLITPNTREANVIRYLLQEQLDSFPDSLKRVS